MSNQYIPECLGPVENPTKPKLKFPAGAWDTHFHVLGPLDQFPYSEKRRYSPPEARLKDILELHDFLGIDRGIVVHANTHGKNNLPFLKAVAQSDGRYLGVVRLTRSATFTSCKRLHSLGIRGARFAFNPQHGGTFDQAEVEHVVSKIKPLGWFVEFHLEGKTLVEMEDWLSKLSVPVIIDHFGRVDIQQGVGHTEFKALLRLAECDHIWTKISGVDRISDAGYPYEDVMPFSHMLIETSPSRIIWGSDWPHTGYLEGGPTSPDDGELIDCLQWIVPDNNDLQSILVSNPARLIAMADGGASSGFLDQESGD